MLLAILIYDRKDRKEGTSLGTETASNSGDSVGRTSGQSDCATSECDTVHSTSHRAAEDVVMHIDGADAVAETEALPHVLQALGTGPREENGVVVELE